MKYCYFSARWNVNCFLVCKINFECSPFTMHKLFAKMPSVLSLFQYLAKYNNEKTPNCRRRLSTSTASTTTGATSRSSPASATMSSTPSRPWRGTPSRPSRPRSTTRDTRSTMRPAPPPTSWTRPSRRYEPTASGSRYSRDEWNSEGCFFGSALVSSTDPVRKQV